ncbi:MAG: hypothetical protein JOS17DRAFT_333568 [Linnemannia elongata]|nr:MAG: hypothetical protein JOS17DRAFT_333568 [Linnemannia elongata]
MAECMEYAPKNPMIQLYLSVQFFNLAMQRTTTNRQVVMGQALVFLQNYYHLRMAGRGSIAFSEREKLSKAKGTSTEAAAGTDAPVFPIIKSKSDDWKDQAEKASAEAVRASSSTSDGSSKPTTLTEPSSTKTTPALIGLPSSLSASSSSFTELPRLAQCQQEAEYNFARAFHQIGQKNLAIIHYRRVLELPSWRQVEREQEAARKVQEQALKDVRWQERATARSAAIERKMERAHHIRQLREAKQALKEEAKKQKLEEKAARAEAKAMAIASGVAAIAEDEDDVEEEVEEMDEDLDDYAEEPEDEDEDILSDDERQGDEASAPPILTRIQVQGEEDEDPTDLKREAAYNLAKIYMLSGAMGEAQLLMRKYCTL